MDANNAHNLINSTPGRDKRPKEKYERDKTLGVCCFYADENVLRRNWGSRFDSFVAFVVLGGLSMLWRLPVLFFRYGRCAFLIPVFFFGIFLAFPLHLMEMALGQFCSRGFFSAFNYGPMFRGLGAAMTVTASLISIYHNAVTGWAIKYLLESFKPLPWRNCDCNSSALCATRLQNIMLANCTEANGLTAKNGTCYDRDGNIYGLYNNTMAKQNGMKKILPACDYLSRQMNQDPFDLRGLRWDLALTLLCAWVIVALILLRGPKSLGRAVYVLLLLTVVFLLVLFGLTLSLPGSGMGGMLLWTPDFSKLAECATWVNAALFAFYMNGLCWGGVLSIASYNRFHFDLVRSAIFVPLLTILISIFAAHVSFMMLGAVSQKYDIQPMDLVTEGLELIFCVLAQAPTILEGPPSNAGAVCLFLLVVVLAIGSVTVLTFSLAVAISDACGLRFGLRFPVALVLCVIFFLLGLPLVTPAGMAILQLLDDYVIWIPLFLLALILILSFVIYHPLRLSFDVQVMLRTQWCASFCPSWMCCKWPWLVGWLLLAPIMLILLFIFGIVCYRPSTFRGKPMPSDANTAGIIIAVVPIILFLIVLCIVPCCLKNRKKLCKPLPRWGPALVDHRKHVTYAEDFVVDPKNDKDKGDKSRL